MRQNAVAQTLRCGSSQPSQFHARRRQSLTFSLPAPFPEAGFGRQVMFVDSRCPAGRLRFDSGGRVRAVASVRQTGNSGVNPGRPRRCDRAVEAGCFQPLRPPRNVGFRAAARRHATGRARKSEDLPSVESLPDREGGMADTAARATGTSNSGPVSGSRALRPWRAPARRAVVVRGGRAAGGLPWMRAEQAGGSRTLLRAGAASPAGA